MDDLSFRHENERSQKDILEKIFESTDLTIFDMFRNFPVFAPRYNLARFLVHYELFQRVYELPGVFIDTGVFRGASTFTWAKLCEIFCPTDVRKVVYAFDTFEGFPAITKEDGKEDRSIDRKKGGFFPGGSIENDLNMAQNALNQDKCNGSIKIQKKSRKRGNTFCR